MRRIVYAIALVLAVSCHGRRNQGESGGNQEDSLAAATVAETPSRAARADTLGLQRYKGPLPSEPILDIVTSMGTIRVKLYKDTPRHRRNFLRLALSHYYDNVLFHRVVNGFVIQGGDPYTRDTSRISEWGEGGPGYTIDAEIVPEHTHKRGALAAARRGNLANPMKESSGSQFYLVQDSTQCKHLNGEYTVFGEAVGGLSVIDRIARTRADRYDRPVNPVVIRTIRLNDEMNRRAYEAEQRALTEDGTGTETAPEPATVPERGGTVEPEIVGADSVRVTEWEGRPLKKREPQKRRK